MRVTVRPEELVRRNRPCSVAAFSRFTLIPEQTLYRQIRRGDIKVARYGRRVLIHPAEINALLADAD